MRIISALLILVGIVFTIGGLSMSTTSYYSPTGGGYGMEGIVDASRMSEKQLRVQGGLAAIGLGILVKMLGVIQAFVANDRRRD